MPNPKIAGLGTPNPPRKALLVVGLVMVGGGRKVYSCRINVSLSVVKWPKIVQMAYVLVETRWHASLLNVRAIISVCRLSFLYAACTTDVCTWCAARKPACVNELVPWTSAFFFSVCGRMLFILGCDMHNTV